MLKHVVMYKLKDNSESEKEKLKAVFLSMKGKIDVLKDIESGTDILKTERSFDVALVCTFASAADLEIYADHPVHQKVREYVHSVVEKSISVDFLF